MLTFCASPPSDGGDYVTNHIYLYRIVPLPDRSVRIETHDPFVWARGDETMRRFGPHLFTMERAGRSISLSYVAPDDAFTLTGERDPQRAHKILYDLSLKCSGQTDFLMSANSRPMYSKPMPQRAPCLRVLIGFPAATGTKEPWAYRIVADAEGTLVWSFSLDFEIEVKIGRGDFDPSVFHFSLAGTDLDPINRSAEPVLQHTLVTPEDAVALVRAREPDMNIDDPAIAWDRLADYFHDHAATERIWGEK